MTPTSPRIAFLDVDGTILDHGARVAASTVEAIRSARARGTLVYLSTGRSACDIHPDVRAIGFDGAVTNGGALATSGETTVVSRVFDPDALARLEAFFARHGIHYFVQTHDAVYASAEVREAVAEAVRARRIAQGADPQSLPQPGIRFRDIADVDRAHVAKAVFVSTEVDALALAREELGDDFHVVAGSMPLPGSSNGEIGPAAVTKGSAIVEVLRHLDIPAEASIGIGDSWNDVEMFAVCGTGIAMGNAVPELQALADEVTTAVDADGVFEAFRRHGLV